MFKIVKSLYAISGAVIKSKFSPQVPTPTTQLDGFQAHSGGPAGHLNHNHTGFGNSKRSGGKSVLGLAQYQKHLIIDHWATRQNTRVAVHESTQARLILKRKNDVVVGEGLKPDPSPVISILGLTPEDGKNWADNTKVWINLWANSKDSDLTGKKNFFQNQDFIKWQHGRDGEYFIRLSYSKDKSLINPVQISFIDPNQIRGDEFTTSFGPSNQEDGITKDKNGKATAYKVWLVDNERPGHFKDVTIPAFDEKTGRPLMIHGFKPEYVGQTRGIPEISYALQEFEDITSFDVATGKKRIMEATLGLTMENEQQTPSDGGFSDINAGGSAGVTVISESSPPVTPVNLGPEGIVHCEIPEVTFTEPGTVHVFGSQKGDKLKAIPNAAPAEKTADYVDYKTRYLSAASSMPFTIATMQMGKAHSASRAELGMLADVITKEIAELSADSLNIIIGVVISEYVAMGTIKAPGFSDPALRKAWLNMNWNGNPLPDVDPLKTKMGIKLDVELGLTDLDTEAQKLNGSSGELNRSKLAKQIPELVTDPFQTKQLEEETENDNEDEPEDEEN